MHSRFYETLQGHSFNMFNFFSCDKLIFDKTNAYNLLHFFNRNSFKMFYFEKNILTEISRSIKLNMKLTNLAT